MRELILKRIADHWDDSLEEIFDIKYDDLYNMTDEVLLDLYNAIFELGII